MPLERLFECTPEDLQKACFITFDDAFADTYIWARPLLLKHEVPASFFIPTACVSRGEVIWPLQLRNSLAFTREKSVAFEGLPFSLQVDSLKGKKAAFDTLLAYLPRLKEREFKRVLATLFEKLGTFNDADIRIMTKDELRTLSAHFGLHSHTRNHYFLSSLTSEGLAAELKPSVDDLREYTSERKVMFLAYPVGDYTDEVASEAGKYFTAAFRVGDEAASAGRLQNRAYQLRIPRFNIHHDSPHEVYAFINGFHGLKRLLGKGPERRAELK